MHNTHTKILRATMLATAGMAGMMAPALSRPVQAQALQPVVDLCTGINLNDSVLTDVLNTTVVPTAAGLERLFDELLDLQLNIGIGTIDLLDIPDVNLGVAETTAALAAGDPISLEVLDSNGDIVSPSNCNITADGYTLNDAAGLAIGGNQITGLGDGLIASAGEVDAIAFGNNASTAVGATGAIALGTDASATAANSVALGAGSIADRGPLTGYSAAFLTGSFDSAGSVSVGAPGALRQITNVAPGSAPTDVATVGQVQAAVDSVNGAVANAVQYDDATQTTVTLDGAGGTTIANVADGTLSATSDEAVNGSQLFATNELVTANAADIADVGADVAINTSNIADIGVDVAANATDIADLGIDVAANATDIGDLQVAVADNSADITVNAGNIATNTTDIAQLQDTAVQYDDATQASVTLGGAGGTTISNVAAGTVSAGSSDAVNGAQLFATNTQVDANSVAIQANADAIVAIGGTGNPLGVAYDDATRTRVTFDGAGGTVLANVDDGELSATSDEAVNGSQLFATNQNLADLDGRVTTTEGDIANLDGRVTVNETDIANIDSRVTVNEGDIADNSTDIANLDGRVTVNTTTITEVEQRLANVPLAYVDDSDTSMSSDTPTNTAALLGAGGNSVRVTNVAAGNVAAGSTDAVNGSQLAATNAQVADNRTDIDQNTSDIALINNNLSGSTVAAVQYSDPSDPTASNGGTISQDVTFIGADSSQPVRVHNVANATLTNDAVNLGQVQAGLSEVMSGSMAYTDQRFDVLSSGLSQLAFDLDEVREDAFSGSASAMALAGIPQTMEAGRSMMGGAIGHYRGETAFAVGFSTTFNDGEGVITAGGTMDTNGKGGFSAGAGFSF
ncbi:MAG: YadA-like family protein [Alteraurantiacibacter sp.]